MTSPDDGDSQEDRATRLEHRQIRSEKAEAEKKLNDLMSLLTIQVTDNGQQRKLEQDKLTQEREDRQLEREDRQEQRKLDMERLQFEKEKAQMEQDTARLKQEATDRSQESILRTLQLQQETLVEDMRTQKERRIRMGRDIPNLPKLEDPKDIQLFLKQFETDMIAFKVPEDQWTTQLRPLLDTKSSPPDIQKDFHVSPSWYNSRVPRKDLECAEDISIRRPRAPSQIRLGSVDRRLHRQSSHLGTGNYR